jgi:hypothetical protein
MASPCLPVFQVTINSFLARGIGQDDVILVLHGCGMAIQISD